MTSFATEVATPSVTDERTYVGKDTLPRLIYKDRPYPSMHYSQAYMRPIVTDGIA